MREHELVAEYLSGLIKVVRKSNGCYQNEYFFFSQCRNKIKGKVVAWTYRTKFDYFFLKHWAISVM